jgi:acyl dehydratase
VTATDQWITPAMRAEIDVETPPYSFDVEKGDMVRFALSTGETNPIYVDEVAARASRYGGLIAAPTFLITMRILQGALLALENPLPNSVDGGTVWTYHEPIRPGDRITARARLADLYEKDGRYGRMLFQVVEIRYENQFGQPVVTQRDTYIRYP